MLSLAKELVAMPSLFLVDEPTAGLAPRVAREVYEVLVRSRELGIAVLLVDQNISEAVRIADYVYVIGMGRVQREGPREDFAVRLGEIVRESLVGIDPAEHAR